MAMAGVIRRVVGKECPSRTGLARVGGNGQMAGWRVSGRRPPSGWEWKGSQSSQGATELVFPGPALGKMQSEATRRAGEPSGEGEEASSEGLGGYQLLTQTDTRGPVVQRSSGPSPAPPARRHWRRSGKAAGSAFLGHPGESPRGRIHIMTIGRTAVGIDKHPFERAMPYETTLR